MPPRIKSPGLLNLKIKNKNKTTHFGIRLRFSFVIVVPLFFLISAAS